MKPECNCSFRRPLFLLLGAAALLAVPAAAMVLTDEVNWTASDFAVAAVLLFGTAFVIEAALRLLTKPLYRIVAVASILLALLIVWAELAVGLIGTPLAGS
jgi:hypothetical protein